MRDSLGKLSSKDDDSRKFVERLVTASRSRREAEYIWLDTLNHCLDADEVNRDPELAEIMAISIIFPLIVQKGY
jgi:hypothetical protein